MQHAWTRNTGAPRAPVRTAMEGTGMQTTQADRVRAYAQDRRVFTRAQLIEDIGEKAAGALGQMAGAEIVRHAVGVYSLAGIRTDDDRVVEMIRETGARPLSDEDRERDARKAEEKAAAALGARMRSTQTIVERVADHFKDHPVASATDLKRLYGQSAAAAAKTLSDRGDLEKVRDGLWTRPGTDPFGPDMKSYVESHSLELAAVKRELEEVSQIDDTIRSGQVEVEWNVSRPQGRGVMVYMNMTGVPSIWAQSRKGRIHWYAVKGLVSPVAADHIARMVLDPMPERMGDLVSMVERGEAPTGMRRRHGGYREYDRPEEDEEAPRTKGYGAWDTHVLDPRRLGNGLPEEVVLEIDDREDDRLVTMLTDVPNLHIIRTHLEMADFVARFGDGTLAIERKTSEDLSASLDDNRLVEQVHRMSDAGIPCCFVIEGGMTGTRSQPLPRLVAMQTRLNFGVNMRVLETLDLAHTAYVIVTSIRDHFFGTGAAFDLKPHKLPGLGPVERAQHMLQTIPGISPTRSAALLERFGSIAGMAGATAKQIMEVEGVGKKTAETLLGVLTAGTTE